jgi:hypothetical protein
MRDLMELASALDGEGAGCVAVSLAALQHTVFVTLVLAGEQRADLDLLSGLRHFKLVLESTGDLVTSDAAVVPFWVRWRLPADLIDVADLEKKLREVLARQDEAMANDGSPKIAYIRSRRTSVEQDRGRAQLFLRVRDQKSISPEDRPRRLGRLAKAAQDEIQRELIGNVADGRDVDVDIAWSERWLGGPV